MLSSPIATIEGVIVVITNVWEKKGVVEENKGETGFIGIRHVEGF